MKIACIGFRAIPSVTGVDSVISELAPHFAKLGHEVTIYVRSPYMKGENRVKDFHGVKLEVIPCIKNKYLETPIYTLLSVIRSLRTDFDIYFFHAVVTGLCIPLVKLFSKKVLFQTHGLDWKRDKWNQFAKLVIKFSTFLGVKYSDEIASVSMEEVEYFKSKFNKDAHYIPNGIPNIDIIHRTTELEKFGIVPNQYILFMSRLVPEKGCHYLIDSWNKIPKGDKKGFKLVIAGGTQYQDKYYYSLLESKSDDIIFTGFVSGELKKQLLSHAALFVQPSTLEGMPLTLLEAMGYGLPVVATNIPGIRELVFCKDLLFEPRNSEDLKEKIIKILGNLEYYQSIAKKNSKEVVEKYNWNNIALQFDKLFRAMGNA